MLSKMRKILIHFSITFHNPSFKIPKYLQVFHSRDIGFNLCNGPLPLCERARARTHHPFAGSACGSVPSKLIITIQICLPAARCRKQGDCFTQKNHQTSFLHPRIRETSNFLCVCITNSSFLWSVNSLVVLKWAEICRGVCLRARSLSLPLFFSLSGSGPEGLWNPWSDSLWIQLQLGSIPQRLSEGRGQEPKHGEVTRRWMSHVSGEERQIGLCGVFFFRERQWVFRAQLHVRMCQRTSAFGTKIFIFSQFTSCRFPDMCNGSAKRHLKRFTLSHVKLLRSVASNNWLIL